MTEFGHYYAAHGSTHIDSWGSGPFWIEAAGKRFRFGDSDRFGPYLADRHGDPLTKDMPGSRSPFWRAHRIWVRQGRRMSGYGSTCVWDEPAPMTVRKVRRGFTLVIDPGEEDGETVVVP